MDELDGTTVRVLQAMVVQIIVYSMRTIGTMVEILLVAEGTIRANQLAPEWMFRS